MKKVLKPNTKLMLKEGKEKLESRVAIIGIIIEDKDSVEELNEILHIYGKFIIGRMGLPYAKREINIISIVIDAPQDEINTLSGKIGKLKGVTSKVAYSKTYKD